MSKYNWKKALPSLVYLLVAAVFYGQTYAIQQSTSGTMGAITPRTVPRVIIICLVICSVINLIHDVKGPENAEPLIQKPWNYLITGLAFVFVIVFAKKLGFVICGFVFLFLLFQVLDDKPVTKKRILLNVAMAAGLSVLLCCGFRYGLKVRVPLYPKL